MLITFSFAVLTLGIALCGCAVSKHCLCGEADEEEEVDEEAVSYFQFSSVYRTLSPSNVNPTRATSHVIYLFPLDRFARFYFAHAHGFADVSSFVEATFTREASASATTADSTVFH